MKKLLYFMSIVVMSLLLLSGCGKSLYGSYQVVDEGKAIANIDFKDEKMAEIYDYSKKEKLFVDYELMKGKQFKYIIFKKFQFYKKGGTGTANYKEKDEIENNYNHAYIIKENNKDIELYVTNEQGLKGKEDVLKTTIEPETNPLVLKSNQ
ncbi:hypothetical protein [Staphylococcus pettenkoferi]|uniref:hypothetical protein n=1 Tax=Staphylococcus pettenkoferi TaxID=170573 RepID=UPI0022745B9E|nr:hypothetical protein [Staphylococcus pettenkoferi]MCY1591693.1 hypothetical protein [Staphylococcus pettenkoferi]MCY1609936.1 hypothetical protein [Staphylococcus pettenkoferi]MCY1624376.1 hypothetical protein [Staphylococcus pettenkoferi]